MSSFDRQGARTNVGSTAPGRQTAGAPGPGKQTLIQAANLGVPAPPRATARPVQASDTAPSNPTPTDPRGQAISGLLQSFQQVPVEVPVPDPTAAAGQEWATATTTTQAQATIPYWNNKYLKKIDGEQLTPPAGFDAAARNTALHALGLDINDPVATGKGYPTEISTRATQAVQLGLVDTPQVVANISTDWAAAWRPRIEAWLIRVGIGIDCNGFVYEALNAVSDTGARPIGQDPDHQGRDRVSGILDSYPTENLSRTNVSLDELATLGKVVDAPGGLQVADVMWIPGHVRILMAVAPQSDGTTLFTTAESTFDPRDQNTDSGNGPRVHFWRYTAAKALEHHDEDEPSTTWHPSGESPTYHRHLAPATTTAGAPAATPASAPGANSGARALQIAQRAAAAARPRGDATTKATQPAAAQPTATMRAARGRGTAQADAAAQDTPECPVAGGFDADLAAIDALFPPTASQPPTVAQLQPAVAALVAWTRDQLPLHDQVAAYLRSPAPQADKVATLGQLGDELTRMELMLGGLYNGQRSGTSWRADASSSALFPDTYLAAAGGLAAGQNWCTSFAGYGFGRLGGDATMTDAFGSGPKQRATGEPSQANPRGGIVFPQDSWDILRALLRWPDVHGFASKADLINQFIGDAPGVLARLDVPLTPERGVFEQFLYDEIGDRLSDLKIGRMKLRDVPTATPAPGDLLILNTTAPANGSDDDHTAMVDRFAFPVLSTIEGNMSTDQAGGRQLDLTNDADLGHIYFLTRPARQLAAQPMAAGPSDPAAGAGLLEQVRGYNARIFAVFSKLASSVPATDAASYDAPVTAWNH